MTERIVWTDNEGLGKTGWVGTVGNRQLFTISWSIKRETSWELRTSLPFALIPARATGNDADKIKGYAERVLARFVTSIGAAFED
jgi:hypothetical protein